MKDKLKRILATATFKDTFVSMLGNVGIAVGGMVFTVIVARSLTPDKFGVFSALIALAMLIGSLGDLGISSALVNFIPKLKDNRHIIISTTFWFQTAVSLLFFLIIVGIIPFKDLLVPGSTNFQLFVVGLLTITIIAEGFSQAILKAERKFLLAASLMMVDSVTKIAILGYYFVFRQVTIEVALLATVTSAAVASVLALSREFSHIRPIFVKSQFNEIFVFARWIAVTRIFTVTISRVDVLLLNSLASSYQAGIFSAAARVGLVFTILVSSLGSVVAPRFSAFNQREHIQKYLQKLILLVGAVSVGMIGCVFLARPIISLIFGDLYLDAIPVFQLLVIAMIPFLFSIVTVNPIIYSYNKPNFIALTTFIQTAIIVVLDVLLIPHYGAFAPPIALAVSNIFVLAMTGIKLKKLLV